MEEARAVVAGPWVWRRAGGGLSDLQPTFMQVLTDVALVVAAQRVVPDEEGHGLRVSRDAHHDVVEDSAKSSTASGVVCGSGRDSRR